MPTLSKTDISRRTAAGLASVWFPATGLPEYRVPASACLGCDGCGDAQPARSLGVVVPLGENRYTRVPTANRLRAVDLDRIQDWLFALHYGLHGYIGDDVILNVGSGNACYTSPPYEVLSVTGRVLSLRGPNPRRLTVQGGGIQAVPPGAMAAWTDGSCYNGKQFYPLVERIDCSSLAEGDVNFTATLWREAPAAMEPADLADASYEPAIVFRWEDSGPAVYRGKAHQEAHFQWNETTAAAGGVHEIAGFVPPWGFLVNGTDGTARISTTYSGGAYTTQVDLSGLTGTATLAYWGTAEAPAALFQAECSNWHLDASGSYGGGYCMARADAGLSLADASRISEAHSGCRFADCTRYAIGDERHSAGGAAGGQLPSCPGDWSRFSGLWHRTDWVERQLAAGLPNEDLYRPGGGGFSVCSLYGAFSEECIGSQDEPRRWVWNAGGIGQRETYSDETGEGHRIVTGAFWAAKEIAYGSLVDGFLPATVAGWKTGKPAALQNMPWIFTGSRETYDQAASAPNVPSHDATGWEEYLTDVSITD